MELALAEARAAAEAGEVPVGAVWVREGEATTRAHNRTLSDCDPTAHAEIVCLRRAAHNADNHRLGGTLYVTLEPCIMCVGAMIQARVETLVFAARDPKAGAIVSLYRLADDERLNHRFAVREGPEADASAQLLREFFEARR
jgi:tRNA(adenine34) deaminase